MANRPGAVEGLEVSGFWTGKRVLLTGHTGFKGGWLAMWLQSAGARVTGFSLPPDTEPNLYTLARAGEGIESIIGDICDYSTIADAIERSEPEIIFHLAAQPLVRRSYTEPVLTYRTNVMGTVHVLEAARHTPSLRVIVNVTSDKCYENREQVWGYRETDPMGGHDPYSNSKGCAELITASYRRSFLEQRGVRVSTARAGNVIGGGDWAEDRLVPDCMRALLAGKAIAIRNPAAVRPWQHVLEPVAGYALLAEKLWHDPALAAPYNFGPYEQDIASVADVVDRIAGLWGGGARVETAAGAQPHEAKLLTLDSTLARTRLGWRPVFNLAGALDRTVRWYRAFGDSADMRELTMLQIEEYRAAARKETNERALQTVR